MAMQARKRAEGTLAPSRAAMIRQAARDELRGDDMRHAHREELRDEEFDRYADR